MLRLAVATTAVTPVQDVGRAVFDADGNLVFFAGGRNHSELFLGDQVLCDALA